MARVALKTVAFALLVVSFLSGVLTQCTPPRCPNFPQRCPRTWNYATSQSWGAACPAWSKCSSGLEQSPLDITPPVNRYGCQDSFLNVRYRTVENFWLFNTGNYFTAPISKADGNTFIYQGVQYVLKQIIFHSPSEHAINGQKYDLEVQFIHDSPNPVPKQLISSVFFQRGANPQPTNQFLESIIYDLPQFSDCKCGNGRLEWTNSSIVSGVNEQCDEGTRNSNASLPAGNPGCCRLDCTPARCGDGVVDFGEQCDLGAGNKNVSGVCRTNCWLPACGDGIVDPGEQCDDGNRHNLDGCSSICLFECGDGEINFRNGLEQCDNGTNNSDTAPNACRKNCVLPFCGDGVADTVNAEQCDNKTNGVNPSQCRGNCSSPICGDGITDLNEDCDDGSLNGPNYACSASCRTNCGDGTVQAGEDCDLAEQNSNAPDALCRANCKLPRCGDGIIDPSLGEQCDSVYSQSPTNTSVNVGNWWCSSTCKQQCGSGLNDSTTKQCDHGCYNADLPNRCRTNCMNPICGDGIIDVVEQCDNGNLNSNSRKDACRMNCVLPKCGDGVLDSNETCDDNNTISGDGCDSTCRLECGNGNLEASAGEQCDLGAGNANVADTCRTNCKLPFCGDGIVDSCEECDDGPNNSDTRPNACRTNCYKPYCGDGVIDSVNGEKCDLAAGNSDTTVDGCSLFCIPNYCRQRKVRPAVDLSLAVPKNRTAYDYQGSISYPPCSENVQWLVFNEPQLINDHQFDAFTKSPYGLVGSRPVQQLGTRRIRRPCDAPPPQCGNGVQEAGEQCDLGRLLNSDWEANRCRTNCRLPSCGDSVTDKGEECDDGPAGSRRCAGDCKLKPVLRNPFVCPPWNYADACKWSLACRLHAACAGDRVDAIQSPINIVTSAVSGVGAPTFGLPSNSYSLSTINFVNTGRSLALLVNGANTLDGFTLSRIEFHSPSEHTVNGVHADLEAQLLHASADGNSFVGVAVLFNRGASKSAFISQFDFYVPKFAQCSLNNGLIETAIGEECDDGAMNSDSRPNTCRRSGLLPRCGDGVVDRGEHCDEGKDNANAANKCKTDCRLPFCGDGFVDNGEQCDPAQVGGRPCDKFCRLLCGNGVVQTGELCDNGTANSDVVPNACRTSCTPARCGDGVIDNGEQCDNGAANGLTPDACRPDCTLPRCGDGIVDLAWNELCDLGTARNGPTSACLANCQPSCGTGLLPTGTVKQCDNGTKNSNTDGACRTDCTLPRCGDGILDRSLREECDLGSMNGIKDRNGGVPCGADCRIKCGNGAVDAALGEQCDAGSLNDDTLPNTCRTNCLLPYCGDGVKDLNEECDFGSQNADASGAPCRSNCVLPRFADGIVDAGEQCDDGNLVNGDGCSSTGQWECGNGRRDGNEECDNGAENSLGPNSCRPQGFRLGARDLSCTNPICGDGIIDDGEQCDEGPLNGVGPNRCRTTCTLPYCGDGIIDPLYGEVCDNGVTGPNPNNDFKIDGCSTTCSDNRCRSCTGGPTKTFSLASVFGDKSSPVARYSGSLTTPPCSERVTWYVLTKPQTISAQQFEIFKQAIGTPNARPVQPLNGRQVSWTAAAGAVCGNCQVEAGEQCDQGDNNANEPNKCRTNCQKPTCGDGIVDDGEQCDNGRANNATGPCNLQCQYVKSCPSSCTGPNCPQCGGQPITPAGDEPQGQCGVTTSSNNSGTIINVAFSEILAGAGCTGPNCLSGK